MKVAIVVLTAVAMVLGLAPIASASDPAIICTSDSTDKCAGRQYCCYPSGMSSSDGEQYCKKLGCKRGGTSSCPTAANVKSCGTRDKSCEQKADLAE
jgi:hypothetical protein